jgi:predicted RNase H-like nuclease (RuvC/YqgF family)
MGTICKPILVITAAVCLFAGGARGQDSTSPSLGDLARQQRQQKEQSKTAPGKDAKASKVITNEEIPEHAGTAAPAGSSPAGQSSTPESSAGTKQQAEHAKSQILAQKSQIATLQGQVDELNESVRFAPANCAENCVGWNERQREKQQRVERMQSQLEEEKRRLEDLQDSARKQGFGSSVYDP